MLDLFASYQKVVKSFCISLYEQEGDILRFNGSSKLERSIFFT